MDDAGTGVRSAVVGKTEFPYPTLESVAVTIPPEVEGVVKGVTTPPTFDTRKQASHFVSIASFSKIRGLQVKSTYHFVPERGL